MGLCLMLPKTAKCLPGAGAERVVGSQQQGDGRTAEGSDAVAPCFT